MFLDNKYSQWYQSIIALAKTRDANDDYIETHHIIPKSLGGNNDKENLVVLSAREHFICHWLLSKMVEGKDKAKMKVALWGMSNTRGKTIPSRLYESLRKNYALYMSEINTGKVRSLETRQKMSAAAKIRLQVRDQSGVNNPAFKGFIYVTPWGRFYSALAAEKHPESIVDRKSIALWCENADRYVTIKSYKKLNASKDSTFRSLGYYVEEVK